MDCKKTCFPNCKKYGFKASVYCKINLTLLCFCLSWQPLHVQDIKEQNKPGKENLYNAFPELEQIDIRSEDHRLFGQISKLSLIVSSDKYLNFFSHYGRLFISHNYHGNPEPYSASGFIFRAGFVRRTNHIAYAVMP